MGLPCEGRVACWSHCPGLYIVLRLSFDRTAVIWLMLLLSHVFLFCCSPWRPLAPDLAASTQYEANHYDVPLSFHEETTHCTGSF